MTTPKNPTNESERVATLQLNRSAAHREVDRRFDHKVADVQATCDHVPQKGFTKIASTGRSHYFAKLCSLCKAKL